jgi:hypothetical protein
LMNRTETYDDVSTVLFLVPFLVSGVYAIYLWARSGLSALLPRDVYLTVTRDPIVFLVGSLAVIVGVFISVWVTELPKRREKLTSLSGTLQRIAIASFVLALVSVLYATGFSISDSVSDFIVGRYSIVFPAMLVLLSYLIVTPVTTAPFGTRKLIGIAIMLLVPAVIYEVGKREILVGLVAGFALLIAGIFVFLWNRPAQKEEETE